MLSAAERVPDAVGLNHCQRPSTSVGLRKIPDVRSRDRDVSDGQSSCAGVLKRYDLWCAHRADYLGREGQAGRRQSNVRS
jgi:hypothetical protein